MAVPSAYLTSTKNTRAIFGSIQKASVPTQGFTYEFLKQLGYTSSSDRPIIPVLKAIGFLDASGRPTSLYRDYKDPAIAGEALARGLRVGYSDLFTIDTEANHKTQQELTGMFARLSDKGESVTSKMASTFHALAGLADFTESKASEQESEEREAEEQPNDGREPNPGGRGSSGSSGALSLRHDIHVHLPLSTDVAVYDAIFKSLRENLM